MGDEKAKKTQEEIHRYTTGSKFICFALAGSRQSSSYKKIIIVSQHITVLNILHSVGGCVLVSFLELNYISVK